MVKSACLVWGLLACASASAMDFGINTHQVGTASANAQVAAVMQQRNLKTMRVDLMYDRDPAAVRDQVQRIRANGGRAEAVLMTAFQWDQSCSQALATVEQDAYRQTSTAVGAVKDLVQDFELLNETQLRAEIRQEVAWNTAGTASAPYQNKPCVASLAAALRGMSRAVRDVRASSGLPLRTILGLVGRDFGFATFMQQSGVLVDVIGFHVYPYSYHASLLTDPWYGDGGPLKQLAALGKPVHINEFNCGEIYDAGYENRAGGQVTEACLQGMARHLKDLKGQAIANVESLHVYELLDEAAKPAPENRFGLMVDIDTPKVHMTLVAALAGATLSSDERLQLTSRGLLTPAELDALQANTSAPVPLPTPPAPAPAPVADTTVPSVQIASPANGSVVARRSSLLVAATATDNVGVKQVRFTLNGVLLCTVGTAPYTCRMQVPGSKGWRGTIFVDATDAAGNTARASVSIATP